MRCEICRHDNGSKKRLRTSDNRLVCISCYICFSTLKEEYKKFKEKTPRYNSPFSAVPPKDVLLRARIALNITHSYYSFSEVLADYYKIETPTYNVNPNKVPVNAIACYSTESNKIYSKDKKITLNTALHEFYHALQKWYVVPRNSYSEEDTRNFALACEMVLGIKNE